MSYELKPLQRIQLWWLAVHGGEGWQKDLKPAFKGATDRDRMIDAGLLEKERRKGNAIHLKLTDRGWAYLGEHMTSELSKTPNAATILEQLLGRLRRHLDARELSLAEFFHPRASVEQQGAAAPDHMPAERPSGPETDGRPDPGGLPSRIAEAYLRASGGERNVRVRLADLRDALPEVPRGRLDETLLEMADRGDAALYRLDNPLEINDRDRDAVLKTPAGDPRHIIYLGGRGS